MILNCVKKNMLRKIELSDYSTMKILSDHQSQEAEVMNRWLIMINHLDNINEKTISLSGIWTPDPWIYFTFQVPLNLTSVE